MKHTRPHPSVVTVSVIAGSLLSGYLAGRGAISAGHDPSAGWPFPDIEGLVIFVLGALVCPLLAVCLVKLLPHMLPEFPYRVIVATLVIPALIAFPMGVAAYHWHARNQVENSRKAAESNRIQRAKSDTLQARLISDPEIALRERWFEWKQGNDVRRYLFMESFKDARVPYTASQLARIYQEAPDARPLVVTHPAGDAEFLANHWSHALDEAEAGHTDTLIAIASNPKTPKELLENLESSLLLSRKKVQPPLKHVLDTGLHGEKLVMSRHQHIQATTETGLIKLYADSALHRSCEWNGATRSATLEARKESSPDGPILYFHGFSENNAQRNVTTRFEFCEGRKSFKTQNQAILWIRQQSERTPTVYRNDGLLVSCAMAPAKNQPMVEIWQILIDTIIRTSLPGGDDAKIIVTRPAAEN